MGPIARLFGWAVLCVNQIVSTYAAVRKSY